MLCSQISRIQFYWNFVLHFYSGAWRQPSSSYLTSPRLKYGSKWSLCVIEDRKANNKTFHLDGNPNAKVGIARSSKKSAVAKPKRNVGKIDDERYQLVDIVDGSDEEEDASDTEDQEV
jgi:hypothetical protein